MTDATSGPPDATQQTAGATTLPAHTTIYLPTTTSFVQSVEVPIAPAVTELVVPTEWFREAVRRAGE